MSKLKPIWVSEDIHATIKAAAASQKKKINEYMKEVSESTKDEFKPVQKKSKWRYL